jgi:hypothetical protein
MAAAVALLVVAAVERMRAHEIPRQVTAVVYAVAEATRIRLLVRVPLEAMRDVELPLRPDGTIDLARVEPQAREAAQLWVVEALRLSSAGRPLPAPQLEGVRVQRPSDPGFRSLADAEARFALPQDTIPVDLAATRALLDVAMTVPRTDAGDALAITTQFARLGEQTTTVLHLVRPDRAPRLLVLQGDVGTVAFDPTWWDAAARFIRMGFTHILDGIDHLLFLLCLVLPIRRIGPLLATVTAFTLAHSITLVGSALGMVPDAPWFPPLIEVLIAGSIVAMAAENLLGAGVERRWRLAFGFGLIHGFGFAFVLRDALQFAGTHLLASLAAFNAGVELGQVAVLLVLVPLLAVAVRLGVPERGGVVLASAVIAHSAWHWMAERWTVLRSYRWQWPAVDAALGATLAQLALLAVIAGGVAWAFGEVVRRGTGSGMGAPAVDEGGRDAGPTSARRGAFSMFTRAGTEADAQ